MKIAVCDPSIEVLKTVRDLLKQLTYVKKIDIYSDIDSLFEELKDDIVYDIVLLEIDWKTEKTGIDYAQLLQSYNPYIKIIYMSECIQDYIEEIFVFPSNPSGFLMKPINAKQLEKNLERIKHQKKYAEGKLIIKNKRNTILIPMEDIIYLESQLHKVNIVLEGKTHQCNERLENVGMQLSSQFLMCHKSYIVNMNYILEFSSGEIILQTGQRIPISKKRYADTRVQIYDYWNMR